MPIPRRWAHNLGAQEAAQGGCMSNNMVGDWRQQKANIYSNTSYLLWAIPIPRRWAHNLGVQEAAQ